MKKQLVACASVPAYLTEETAREIDDLVKTLPTDCAYIRKAVTADMTFEPGEKAEVSIINTDAKDREGEVILPEGIQMDAYRKNSVVLFNHDHERPIARSVWVKLFHNQIRAKTNYDLPPETPECDFKSFVTDCWAMVLAGVLKGKSVGLLPLTPRREATPEEIAIHPDWVDAGIRDSCIMLEYSVCSTGVNADCLVEQINTKSISIDRLVQFGIDIPPMPVKVPSKEEVIRMVLPFLKAPPIKKHHKPKPKPRPPIDVEAMIEKALAEIDINEMVKKAQQIYKDRGRV